MTADAPLTADELAAIAARADAATPGPWEWEEDLYQLDSHGFPVGAIIRTQGWSRYGYSNTDAEFIARARTDVPRLVAEVERLREANERYMFWLDRVDPDCEGWDEEAWKQRRARW